METEMKKFASYLLIGTLIGFGMVLGATAGASGMSLAPYTFAQFEQDCQDNTAYGLRKLFLHPIDSVHLHYFHVNVPKRMSLRELYDLHFTNMGKSLMLILKGRDWLTPEA